MKSGNAGNRLLQSALKRGPMLKNKEGKNILSILKFCETRIKTLVHLFKNSRKNGVFSIRKTALMTHQ